MKNRSRLIVSVFIVLLISAAMVAFVGCGGDDASDIYLSLSERGAWGPHGGFAVTAWGANRMLYIYAVSSSGNSTKLLTKSDDDGDYGDEGGRHPTYGVVNGERYIFMSARRNGKDSIYRIDASAGDDNQDATLITAPPGDGADSMPDVSEDNTKIVFVTTQDTGNQQIAVADIDGSNREVILSEAGANLRWPVFNDDGTKIAFERRVIGDDQSDIWVCNADGSDPQELLGSDFDEGAPAWSPDGNTILFHSDRNGPYYDIWAMDADGTNGRAYTSTSRNDGYPIWSADGEDLAFIRDRELWKVNFTADEDERDYDRVTRQYD
ncbi:MAG: hypothetical protein R6V19_09190 [Armatimonadota bacterium]